MKRTAFLMVMVLSAAMVFGNGQGEPAADSPDSISFSIFAPIFDESPIGSPMQDFWLESMERYLAVGLDITWNEFPWAEINDRQTLYMAAGDYDDIFVIRDEALINEAGQAGLTVNLTDHPEWTPNYNEWLAYSDSNMEKATDSNGEIYAFLHGFSNEMAGTQWNWMARFDKFREHGIDPPATFDELLEVAREFKDLYPDSFPVGSGISAGWYDVVRVFLTAHHMEKGFYWDGTEWRLAPVQDSERYREVLALLNTLYEEELLEPEFFNQSGDLAKQRAVTGRYFIQPNTFRGWVWGYNAQEDYPEVHWGLITVPENLFGEPSWALGTDPVGKILDANLTRTAINAETEYPEILTKLVDYQLSYDIYGQISWGIEGETYEETADGRQFLPVITEAEDQGAIREQYGMTPGDRRSGIQIIPIDKVAEYGSDPLVPVWADGRYWDDNTYVFTSTQHLPEQIQPVGPSLSLTPEETEFQQAHRTPIDTYINEQVLLFVIGERDLSEFDEFVETIGDLGDYEGLLNIYNNR